jgi:hypothetical protein
MSRGQIFAYSENLRREEERKARERYWKKIFAQARPPAKKSKS